MERIRRAGLTVAGLALLGGALATLSVAAAATAGSATARPVAQPAPDPAGTVWLCRPGQAPDPCTVNLSARVVPASGPSTLRPASPAAAPAFDCFYVYPTVSTQRTANADLRIQPAEVGAAVAQAARFSQVCSVWAPVYRQRTAASEAAGLGSDPRADTVAYASVLSAWQRLPGQRQRRSSVHPPRALPGGGDADPPGPQRIDPSPGLRARMVSALIVGGNVQVPAGRLVGGSFRNVPGCSAAGETGCVIAYSSFPSRPPADVRRRAGPARGSACSRGRRRGPATGSCARTRPPWGADAALVPYFVSGTALAAGAAAPWTTYPDLYTARCATSGGATWLQVGTTSVPGDRRPTVTEALGPDWGYHLDDVNLALGNLVADVARQEIAYMDTRR